MRVVVLVRGPLEIVASSRLRKPAWKEQVAPDADLATYLDLKIRIVRNFYPRVFERPRDLVRYEDVREDAAREVARLAGLVGIETDGSRAAESRPMRSAREAGSHGPTLPGRARRARRFRPARPPFGVRVHLGRHARFVALGYGGGEREVHHHLRLS